MKNEIDMTDEEYDKMIQDDIKSKKNLLIKELSLHLNISVHR